MDKSLCNEKKAVEVIWHGHACFEVRSGKNPSFSILILKCRVMRHWILRPISC